MGGRLQLFAGSASQTVAAAIAEAYGTELGELELRRFKDGEMQPSFGESIRGNDIFIIQSTYPGDDHIFELLLTVDAAIRASAKSITCVMPYFGYARQDRKDQPRVSIGASLVAKLLCSLDVSRVVTMDLHAGQIQGFFDIPVDNLDSNAIFVPYINGLALENLTMASPDMGGASRARRYAKYCEGDLVLVNKHRPRPNVVGQMQLIGEVEDRNVVIVDDIIDTGGTLCAAADRIMERGARSVRACITHPLLSGDAVKRIEDSALAELVVTDTIPLKTQSEKIRVLSIANIFARALRNIYEQDSVSSLFLS